MIESCQKAISIKYIALPIKQTIITINSLLLETFCMSFQWLKDYIKCQVAYNSIKSFDISTRESASSLVDTNEQTFLRQYKRFKKIVGNQFYQSDICQYFLDLFFLL